MTDSNYVRYISGNYIGDKVFDESDIPSYIRQDGAAGFTRASTSTITVTDNATNQGIFVPGLPVAYRQTAGSGSFSYGIIKSYAAGTVTIMGVSLPNPLGEFRVGPAQKVFQVALQVTGTLSVGDDQLNTVMKTAFHWLMSTAYLVAARGYVETAAGADLHIMIGVGGAATDLLTAVLNLAQATSIVDSGITINSTNYVLAYGTKLYLNIDQIGSGTPGSNLTVELLSVLP